MAKKRVTPDKDFQRLAENLYHKKGRFIRTKEDFQKQFRDYMKDNISVRDNDVLMERTARFYQNRTNKFEEPSPKMKTVINEQQARHFKKASSQVRQKPKIEEFKFLRQIKGKTVFAREIMTSRGVRFITTKGKYAGVRR